MQLLLGAAIIALFANSAVDRTDDGLPWEVTLAGFCVFGVVFAAIYAKKTEVALSIVSIIFCCVPTYFVHNSEIPANNYELGSRYPLATSQRDFMSGAWRADPNCSRFDKLLPGDFSISQLSLFPAGVAIRANTTEIYHSGLKLDDPLTKERTHDYLLLQSPRKVKDKLVSIMLLAKVPVQFEVWPQGVEDYTFNLQTASSIVAPPTLTGELVKLDKGEAMKSLKQKHYLRPFLLDVYKVDYHFD